MTQDSTELDVTEDDDGTKNVTSCRFRVFCVTLTDGKHFKNLQKLLQRLFRLHPEVKIANHPIVDEFPLKRFLRIRKIPLANPTSITKYMKGRL